MRRCGLWCEEPGDVLHTNLRQKPNCHWHLVRDTELQLEVFSLMVLQEVGASAPTQERYRIWGLAPKRASQALATYL